MVDSGKIVAESVWGHLKELIENGERDFTDVFGDIDLMHHFYGMKKFGDDAELSKKFLEFRIKFMEEELDELRLAFKNNNAEDITDAMVDMLFVVITTMDLMGIDCYKAWNDVLLANMDKIAKENPNRPNPLGLPDLVKPEHWVAPTHYGNIGCMVSWKQ